MPTHLITRATEAETCRAIVDQLAAYRELAVREPPTSLLTLQLGLAEFEHEIDFLAEGHDWGIRIVELLVVVRRDWSTAHAAYYSGDSATVEARMSSALDALDEAINVPCP